MKELSDYSDDDLLAEIQRRRAEAQRRLDRFAVAVGDRPKYTAKSEAKRAYWEAFRASGLTLKQFQQKSKRTGKGK